MRRAAAIALLALLLAGCGSAEEAAPLPETVVGTVEQEPAGEGDPDAGRQIYLDSGCGGCHTYEPAETSADVGPNLDELPQLAEDADQGTLAEFTRSSLVNPDAYVEEGFSPGVMPPFRGSQEELNNLVAFLTLER